MSYRDEVMADSPVSYWKLDETSGTSVADEQAVNTGTHVGTPTINQTGLILSGKSVLYPTASTYTQLKAAKIVAGMANWTVEFWCKQSNNVARFYYVERPPTGNDILKIEGPVSGTRIDLTYRDDAGTLNQLLGAATVTMHDGNRHHVVVRKTGTAIAFFVDKTARGTGTLTASDNFTSGTIVTNLSRDAAATATGNVASTLDEVAVYSTALSLARIEAHYDVGIAETAASTGRPANKLSLGLGIGVG